MKSIVIGVMSLFLMASCSHSAKHSEKTGCADCAKGSDSCGTECKERKANGGCDDCKDHHKAVPKKS